MATHRYDEAEPLLLLSHERDSRTLPPGHPNRIEGLQKLINLYEDWGQPDKAAPWREALRQAKSEMP